MHSTTARALALALFLATGASLAGATPAAAQSSCGTSVIVGFGDTLNRIAVRCGVTISGLLQANPQITNPNIIERGARLRLPGSTGGGNGGGDDGNTGRLTVTGTITNEGVECPALRGDDGRLYTLTGDLDRFGRGDRVQVRGVRAEVSICQQGTTIEVRGIRSAEQKEDDTLRVTGTLTREGVECPALRGDDGRLYTLATRDDFGFDPGDRVTVEGRLAEFSFCMQGETIDVDRIRAAR